jgi:hypothetical protein
MGTNKGNLSLLRRARKSLLQYERATADRDSATREANTNGACPLKAIGHRSMPAEAQSHG